MNPYANHIKEIDSILVKLQSRITMLEKRQNAVNRMKRVVKGTHFEFTDSKAFDYRYNHYKSQLDKS